MIRDTVPVLGSEEMFAPDPKLLTINRDDLRTSTPIDHQLNGDSFPDSQPQDMDGSQEDVESLSQTHTGECCHVAFSLQAWWWYG
ncbi:UNVERIFIED_CONTAM: hypothetical protein K2H54_045532 [Gekko kuhli]